MRMAVVVVVVVVGFWVHCKWASGELAMVGYIGGGNTDGLVVEV